MVQKAQPPTARGLFPRQTPASTLKGHKQLQAFSALGYMRTQEHKPAKIKRHHQGMLKGGTLSYCQLSVSLWAVFGPHPFANSQRSSVA